MEDYTEDEYKTYANLYYSTKNGWILSRAIASLKFWFFKRQVGDYVAQKLMVRHVFEAYEYVKNNCKNKEVE